MIEIIAGLLILILIFIGAAVVKSREDAFKTIEEAALETEVFKRKLRSAVKESDSTLLKEVLALSDVVARMSKEGLRAVEKVKNSIARITELERIQLQNYADSFDDVEIIAETLRLAYTKLQEGKISFERFKRIMLEELEDLERMNRRHRFLRES